MLAELYWRLHQSEVARSRFITVKSIEIEPFECNNQGVQKYQCEEFKQMKFKGSDVGLNFQILTYMYMFYLIAHV